MLVRNQPSSIDIRQADPADAPQLAAIYAPYVNDTAISFELLPPDADIFARRIRQALRDGDWLVADGPGGDTLGYACAQPYRPRAAYRWTVETSAYIAAGAKRHGIGRALYQALFKRLSEQGFCTAMAAVTLPNPASVAFHQQLGFAQVGQFHRVGRKFGRWHDVAWFQHFLRQKPPEE